MAEVGGQPPPLCRSNAVSIYLARIGVQGLPPRESLRALFATMSPSALQQLFDISSAVEDRNNRERSAFRVVNDEIRVDTPELEWPAGQVFARVADAGPLGKLPDSVVNGVPHANRCGFASSAR